MNLRIDLSEGAEQSLLQLAKAKGLSVEAYLSRIVANHVGSLSTSIDSNFQFEQQFDEASQGLEQLPVLPLHLSREDYYDECD